MVANPNDVPDAFRKRHRPQPPRPGPLSFIGMTDDQVLKAAAKALQMVQQLPYTSVPRRAQWDSFEAAMGELGRRAVTQTLEKLWEFRRLEGHPRIDGQVEPPAIEPGEDIK